MKLVDPKIVGLKLLIVVPRSEKGNVSPYPGSDCYFCFRFYDWILYMKWILNLNNFVHLRALESTLKSKVRERLKKPSDLNDLEIQRKELLKQLQLAVKSGLKIQFSLASQSGSSLNLSKRSRTTIDNLKQNTCDSDLKLKNKFVTGKV